MKRIHAAWLLLFLFCTAKVNANHLLGGELGYTFISSSGNSETYRVRLTLLGDCASSASDAFVALIGADPVIKLYNGNSQVVAKHLVMNTAESDIDITPLCPDEAGNNTCNDLNSPYPGIKKFVYEGDFVITSKSANWKFTFEGIITSNTFAGRSNIIQNADVLGGSSIMYLYATLNNTSGTNSTPQFTAIPSPFFCVNTQQNYSLGAVDPNGDNLNFSLMPAQQLDVNNLLTPPVNIQYNSPYSATQPLPTSAGNFAFNNINGQITFNANAAINCLVVSQVKEYRNNELVGSSMREMIFVILANCNNTPPSDSISDGNNVTIINQNNQVSFEVCYGQNVDMSFDINPSDLNGDNITLSWNNLPAGATITVANNGTQNPVAHFVWNPQVANAGNYTFYIQLLDDGCPLSSNQTIGYTLQIVPLEDSFNINSILPCQDMANGSIWIQPVTNQSATYDYVWKDESGAIIKQHPGSTMGDTLSNIMAGNYVVEITDSKGCRKDYQYNLVSSSDLVQIYCSDTSICPHDSVIFSVSNTELIDSWVWNFGDGTDMVTDASQITHQYNEPGSYAATLITNTVNDCVDTFQLDIKVNPLPDVSIKIAPTEKEVLCVGDTVKFFGTGADSYFWSNSLNSEIINTDTFRLYLFDYTGTVWVNGVDINGCADSAATTLTAEPCCTLLMPNAFSPNSDGINDVFGPVTNGHPKDYQFQVFNRWGERIFIGFKAEDKWDGTFRGKPAEEGIYFYQLNGTCVNGEKIHQKGDFVLVK